MPQETKTDTIYFETPNHISVIEDVDNVDEYLEERKHLAIAMGFDVRLLKKQRLEIFDDGELMGTYFSKKYLN